jgi:hypothetical protein
MHGTRDLAPLVKGGYIPIGRPEQLPEGEVDSSLSPTLKGGGLPQAQTKREESSWRQRHAARWGSYALRILLILGPTQW